MWVVNIEKRGMHNSIYGVRSQKPRSDTNKQMGCGIKLWFYAIIKWKCSSEVLCVFVEHASILHCLLAAWSLRRSDATMPRLTLAAAYSLTLKRRVCFNFMPFCYALLYLTSLLSDKCIIIAQGYAMTWLCISDSTCRSRNRAGRDLIRHLMHGEIWSLRCSLIDPR